MTKLAMSLSIVLAVAGAAASQQPPSELGHLRQIIPGHYVYTLNNNNRLFNSGIVSTGDGVLVFDALEFEAVARAERQSITDTLKQPVRYLVMSPFHDSSRGIASST